MEQLPVQGSFFLHILKRGLFTDGTFKFGATGQNTAIDFLVLLLYTSLIENWRTHVISKEKAQVQACEA